MDVRTQWSTRLVGAAALLAGTVSPLAAQDSKPVMRVSSASTAPVAPTAVAQAAMRGDIAAVRALIASRADVNAAQGDGMTALHWAADRGDAAMASALIKAGAKLTPITRNGAYTPLHVAARAGNGAVVQTLLAAGADAKARTETGATALHLAAQSGDVTGVKALVAAKADVNAKEPTWGQTPLMFAAASDRAGAISALMAAGADASIRTSTIDLTEELSRQQAAARKRNEVLFSFLPEKMRDSVIKAFEKQAAEQAAQLRLRAGAAPATPAVGAQLGGGATPARAAAPAGAAPAAATVAAAGTAPAAKPAADSAKGGFKVGVQAPPVNDLTPAQVQEAILAGRAVYDNKQKVDGKIETIIPADTTNGFNAGYEATVGSMGGLSALHHAARQGNLAAAMALIDAGANINEVAVSDSVTPLLMATINGQFDLAMAMVKKGANVRIESIHGLTPLYATINVMWHPRSRYPQPQAIQTQKTTHVELMDAMIKAGADVNVRLRKNLWFFGFSNCGNANCGLEALDGTTAFWRATYGVDLEAMKLLKAAGANDTVPQYKAPTTARRGGGGFGRAPATPLDASIDSASKAVPPGIGVYPIHAAAGVGYGNGFAGNSHRHAPDGWMPVMKYLVEELHQDVNKRDINGYTPLHHAAARGDNEMINYLVSKGADPKAVGRDFKTTIDMANGPVERLRPFPETIVLLEKLGAKNSHRCVSC
jgi:ankyrin repeat protein